MIASNERRIKQAIEMRHEQCQSRVVPSEPRRPDATWHHRPKSESIDLPCHLAE